MAYNKGYNPDALPAHAEPEQAAAMLSQSQSSSRPPPQQPPRTSSRPDAYSKLPSQQGLRPSDNGNYRRNSGGRYDDRYNSYDNRPMPGSYNSGPPPPQGYNEPGRQPSPRYNQDPVSPRYQGYGSPPPPQDYGRGARPEFHGRPPVQNRPPPTPAPPPRDGNDREALWRLFGAVDKDRSGQLTGNELRAALVNGDWTSFDPHTVKMMIRMFDIDRSGTISFDEFCGLWGFLAAWRNLFDRFDTDHSGNISFQEFQDALVAFGYRLSPQFVTLLFRTYDVRGQGGLSFDLFVQACISLKRMTDVFKKYDEDRDGYITLSFEEFLTEIIKQR